MKKSILFLAALVPSSVFAQVSEDSLLSQLRLDEVIVSAPVMQVSNSKKEVKYDELNRDNTGQNLPYLLQTTPSLVTTSDDGLGVGYSYFRIRGTDHTRINMTINEVPLNDAESQTVFWVNMTDLASGINSLQVQRGVGTSANGGSSFGASVNLRTVDGLVPLDASKEPFHGQVDFNGGMYNTFREMVKLYRYIGDRQSKSGLWHIGGRFSKVNSDGYVHRSQSDLFSYSGEVGWQNMKTAVTLMSFGGKEKTHLAWNGATREQLDIDRRYNSAGEHLDAYGNIVYYDNETDNYQQHHAQLHVTHRFTSQWSLAATAHYTFGTGYWENYDEWVQLGITQKGLINHFYGGILSAKYVHEKVDVQMGIALNNYHGIQYGNIDTCYSTNFKEYYRGYGDKLDGNVYAKANWRVFHRGQEKLSLYGDLQYRLVDYRISGDNENSSSAWERVPVSMHKTWHFFNPKAGLTYDNGGHRLSATFAIANREPARANFTNNADDKDPLPEQLFDYELGYSYTSIRNARIPWTIGLNLYMMDYTNQLILTGEMNSIGILLTKNVKDSYRLGAEFSFGVDWTKWFSWRGNLTWSRNQWKDGQTWKTISFSPDWIAGNTFDFHVAGFAADIQTQVVSNQYLDNTMDKSVQLNTYTVTNVTLSYDLPLQKYKVSYMPNITLRCQINNLFNSKYESNGYVYEDAYTPKTAYYMAQAGINVHAGVSVQW